MMKYKIFITLFIISFLSFSCKNDEPIDNNPKADFSFVLGFQGSVFLQNESINADSLIWDLGDGTTDKNPINFVYKYSKNGVYQVTLTVTRNGITNKMVKSVFITNL